ncbi:GGDEF domain-containing protein [Spirochaeta cellobiosiphila]|uniref:GGDEF domain-containing protein n=1 Tax=Spirochaeta cellobiosiphila TaxID=504483 RepID=UPI0003FC956C|nr:sensor domain-containing diguanylate cyclase [Spirochaeta cellobiosiphila]
MNNSNPMEDPESIEALEPVEEVFSIPCDYEAALQYLGLFEKDLVKGTVISNCLWDKHGPFLEDIMNEKWLADVHPDDRDRLVYAWRSVVEGQGNVFVSEYRIKNTDGDWIWILNKAVVIERDPQGFPVHYVGIDIDITDKKHLEEKLYEFQKMAEEKAIEAESLRVASAVLLTSLDFDEALQRILQQASYMIPSQRASIYIISDKTFQLMADTVLKKKKMFFSFPSTHPCMQALTSGSLLVFENTPIELPDIGDLLNSVMAMPIRIKGEPKGVIMFQDDHVGFFETVHKRLILSFADYIGIALQNADYYGQARQEASKDTLTGMYTRRWFLEQLKRLIAESKKSHGPLALLLLDLDHFKLVNDQYGHLVGDEVLVRFSNNVRQMLRSSDICCRYGGEEFIVLLPDTQKDKAISIGERLIESIHTIQIPSSDDFISVSIGLALYDSELDDQLEDIIERADRCLYRAKDMGRNRLVY